jgi:hypothetical protein
MERPPKGCRKCKITGTSDRAGLSRRGCGFAIDAFNAGDQNLSLMTVLLLLAVFLMALLLAGIETGRRIRLRRQVDKAGAGLGVIDGAVFGLLSLLLAFSFSGADSRFEARRQFIVQETNSIGTVWLRIDLLPPAAQPQLRQDLRQYVDERIAFYRDLSDEPSRATADAAASNALQMNIWS